MNIINKVLSAVLAAVLAVAGTALPAAETIGEDRAAVRVPVLAYHSIMPREFYYIGSNADNPWILLEEVFYEHMRYLYENGFTPMSVAQLEYFLFYGGCLPERPVVLTFDDGYLDNYLFAAPIMREFGFTGMMFLITGSIPEICREMTYRTQTMSEAQIRATEDVFEHGSHTHNMHRQIDGAAVLELASVPAIRVDLRRSFEGPLTFRTGFAYPFGRHSPNALEALRAEGVRFAFTTAWGYVYRDTHPLRLPRFSITSRWTFELFSDIVWGRW